MNDAADNLIDELFAEMDEQPPLHLHFDQQQDSTGDYVWTVTATHKDTKALLATVPAREGSPGILIAIGQYLLTEFREAVVEISGYDEDECRLIGRSLRPR
jgi:hypothetical protein